MTSTSLQLRVVSLWLWAVLTATALVSCQDSADNPAQSEANFSFAQGDTIALQTAVDTSHARLRRYLFQQIDSITHRVAQGDSTVLFEGSRLHWLIQTYTSRTDLDDLNWHYSFVERLSAAQAVSKVRLDSLFSDVVALFRQSELPGGASAYCDSLAKLCLSYERLGDSAMVAAVHSYLAHEYYDADRIDEAMDHLALCLCYCNDLELVELEANTRLLKAKALSVFFADFAGAERERTEALELYGLIGLDRRRVSAAAQWAYLLHQLHKPREAARVLIETLAACREYGDMLNEAYCSNLLAECYLDLGQPDSALASAEISLEVSQALADAVDQPYYRSSLGYAQSTLGIIHAELGHNATAHEWFEHAEATFEAVEDQRGRSVNAGRMASHLLEHGEIDRARVMFEDILQTSSKFETQIFALYGLATCHYFNGERDRAIRLLKACIGRYQTARNKMPVLSMRSGMLSDKIGFYHLLAHIHLERYVGEEDVTALDSALTVMEASRAQTLLDQLALKSPSISTEELDLICAISDIQTELLLESPADESLEQSLVALEDSLRQFRMSESALRTVRQEEVHLVTVQGTLGPDEVLLEYLLSPYGSWVVAIHKDDVNAYKLPVTLQKLEGDIADFLRLVSRIPSGGDLNSNAVESLGARIREQVLPSNLIATLTDKHVMIAASGQLHQLPFDALPGVDNRPLVLDATISYVPSFASTRTPSSGRDTCAMEPTMVAIGNPRLPVSSGLPPLPFANRELSVIAEVFNDDALIVSGEDATESTLATINLREADILHFATHALCDPVNPNRSALVLTYDSSSGTSGFMHMDELRGLKLGTPLVFLSACRTGDGMLVPGEGVMGIARAFLETGAKSVVATRWSVSDRSSVEFTRSFYSHLTKHGSACAALCAAKRDMIGSSRPLYRHPYYWAPYMLIGAD